MVLPEVVVVYLFALGLGIAVSFGVYADLTRRGHPRARRRGLVALGFGVVGLFVVPLVLHARLTRTAGPRPPESDPRP